MKPFTNRLCSALLLCAMVIGLLPVSALAGEKQPNENPAWVLEETPEQHSQGSSSGQDLQAPRPADGTVVEIESADDLAAAIAGQEDGQIWNLAPGVYHLTQEHLNQYAHWDAPGQGGWYFPLYADGLTLLGEGQVVITSTVESANGAWASQDFVSVWGDGITIDGIDFQSKYVPNKAIEIMGRDFTLRNCTLLPVVHPDAEQGEVFSGSIYFNPLNEEADLGNSTLEQVTLHAYVSASAARAGTLNVRGVTMDATNNVWSIWGSGYGPGLVGDVYSQIEGVRYLVDDRAVLSDILDSGSPYASDTKPGTTIEFAPGVYELQAPLTIGQDVTLVGAGREHTVFQAAAEPVVLLQVAGGDVNVSISGIHIKGVEENSHNNSSALQVGSNSHPNTGHTVVRACRFSDFTKNSITVKGGSASISESIIDCKPYPGAAGNGIQIDLGAEAVITGNVINGYTSQAENWSACGVLVLRDGKITQIRENRITACGIGIVKETYYDADSDRTYLDPDAAKNNTFQDCGQDVDFEFDLFAEVAAYSGGVIRLPHDVELDKTLILDKDIAIDGNGFTIYGAEGDSDIGLEVAGGTVQLSNMTLKGLGRAADGAAVKVPADADPETRLVCTEVYVEHISHRAYHIASGTVSIAGGAITCTGSDGGNATAIVISGPVQAEVSGCVIRGVRVGIEVQNHGRSTPGAIAVSIRESEIAAAEDAVLLSGGAQGADAAEIRIFSGTFLGNVRIADETDRDTIAIEGGRFSADPSEYVVPERYISQADGLYVVSAQAPDEEQPGDDSSGGTTQPVPPPTQPQPSVPETSDGQTTVSTQVTATVSGDTSRAEIHPTVMDKAVESVLEAAAQANTAPVVELVVDSGTAKHVEVQLPVSSLEALGRHESALLTVASGVATVKLDSAAITAVTDQAGGAQITLAVSPVAAEELNEKQQAAAGGAPVFDLHLKSGEGAIPHFGGGSATVSLPHSLSEGQKAERVAVYYLDDQGNTSLRGTTYDAEAETVTFTTPHFSKYMVGYVQDVHSFADVAETDYFYPAVQWAVEQGVTAGTSADTFSPHQACTRSQAVMFLWRAAGSPQPALTSSPFSDVLEGDAYYDAVLWAVEKGITAGTSADTFSPDAPCTRAQIATFLWRWDGTHRAAFGLSFTDVDRDAYYYDAVLWAAERGITAGTSPNTFSPEALCTRAQIVTFLFRCAEGRAAVDT